MDQTTNDNGLSLSKPIGGKPTTFKPGNQIRKGSKNPISVAVQRLRGRLYKVVDPARIERIALKLCELAEAGDVSAAREIFDRLLGKPRPAGDEDDQSPRAAISVALHLTQQNLDRLRGTAEEQAEIVRLIESEATRQAEAMGEESGE